MKDMMITKIMKFNRTMKNNGTANSTSQIENPLSSTLSNTQIFKICMMFGLFIICLVGLLPALIPRLRNNKAFLSYLNCFSGGIFLSMALVHMLPGTITSYERWGKKKGLEHLFPLPTVMMLAGYLLVLLLDRVIMVKIIQHHNQKKHTVQQQEVTKIEGQIPKRKEETEAD